MATLDPPLDLLRSQILACTALEYGEIGWVGDPDHASRTSAHNPEYPAPPSNPAGEVDAIDPPHAPSRGADMAVLTEALRQSRDPRIKLVIFNRRIFSSYDHADGPAWTWRPYSGDNPHDKHAHIERTDQLRGDLRPWSIGIDNGGLTMFLAACKVGDSGPHVQFLQHSLWKLHEARKDAAAPSLWAATGGVPTLPSRFDTKTGSALKSLLGGNGVDFTPLLAVRLVAALGALDGPPVVTDPGAGVSEDRAREIAADVVRNAAVTITPSAE
jgi:hypothetical protein